MNASAPALAADAFAARRAKLFERARAQGFGAALATKPASIRYLCGLDIDPHERFAGLFLRGADDFALAVPALDASKARQYADNVLAYSDAAGPDEAAAKALGEGAGALAVEKDHLTLGRAEWLRGLASGLEFGSLSPLLAEARSLKDAREIALIREAVRVIEESIAEALQGLRRGMTELELANRIESLCHDKGAERMSFGTLVLSGAKSAQPHGSTGREPIREGEYLLIDAGVFKDGYCSDITRTFFVGANPSARHREVFEAVLEGNKRAIAATKPGARLGDIDLAARNHIASKGFGDCFIHRLGHGFGIEIHEEPSVSETNDAIAKPGLAFTIEPGVYIDGFGGVRIEDDVVVSGDGADVLTSYPKDWKSCQINFAD